MDKFAAGGGWKVSRLYAGPNWCQRRGFVFDTITVPRVWWVRIHWSRQWIPSKDAKHSNTTCWCILEFFTSVCHHHGQDAAENPARTAIPRMQKCLTIFQGPFSSSAVLTFAESSTSWQAMQKWHRRRSGTQNIPEATLEQRPTSWAASYDNRRRSSTCIIMKHWARE